MTIGVFFVLINVHNVILAIKTGSNNYAEQRGKVKKSPYEYLVRTLASDE